ncbi:tetratricopeptide repeat protein [Streptomyces sp. SID3343]|uniref:tetratricopeptide repeat protein n=1 Tax=Streptomyces sp. SID3343 TaxID=2690260 RepID=UPI00136D1AE6|nr:tetratricopeptide repeat protein [Streptomyces sp. SID3343]
MGRHEELADFRYWRDDTRLPGLAVRLLHAPGGEGKTRLAAQIALEAAEDGWAVLEVRHRSDDSAEQGSNPAAVTGKNGVLAIVDYAERWPVGDLFTLLGDTMLSAGVPVRLLLLSRTAGGWWDRVTARLDDLFDLDAETVLLRPLGTRQSDRQSVFDAACDRFAEILGADDAITAPHGLQTDDAYALVLTIHMAALAAVDAMVHGVDAPGEPLRVSKYLLRREREHWDRIQQAQGTAAKPFISAETMARVVFTSVLTQAVPYPTGVQVLELAGIASTAEGAAQVLDDHRYCYPSTSGNVLEPLSPDRLAEDFIGLTCPGAGSEAAWASGLLAGLLKQADEVDPTSSPAWMRSALIVFIEAAKRWPHLAATELYPLLRTRPELARLAGGAGLLSLLEFPDVPIDVLRLVERELYPEPSVEFGLAGVGVAIRVAEHTAAASADPVERATIRTTLGVRLTNVGLHDDALTAAQEAVRLWVHLATQDPGVHMCDFAGALINLSTSLAGTGQREAALDAVQDAVHILRARLKDAPDVHLPVLALALSNSASRLAALGKGEEALAASQEAVGIRRGLVATDPERFLPGFVRSLIGLANRYARSAHPHDALEPAEEAVGLLQAMSDVLPDTYLPDYAEALDTLARCYSAADRPGDALVPMLEAVDRHHSLASALPRAYLPDFARSMTNLAGLLTELGHWEDAGTTASAAVDVCRVLVQEAPQTHLPLLARALNNHATALAGAARPDEALRLMTEAVDLFRQLAHENPGGFQNHFEQSLTVLTWIRGLPG